MGNLSSGNFKPTNLIQKEHNDRTLAPDYLLPLEVRGKNEINRTSQQASILEEQIIIDAIVAYEKRTKKDFKAKKYRWSLVVNLKETSNMQELENLAKHFEEKYGFQCYQIAIHKDEGYVDENKQPHINHHAHMEFITLDKNTGINRWREINQIKLRQIQSEIAQILGMERGMDKRISGVKRIEPRAYAHLLEKQKQQNLLLESTKQELIQNALNNLKQYNKEHGEVFQAKHFEAICALNTFQGKEEIFLKELEKIQELNYQSIKWQSYHTKQLENTNKAKDAQISSLQEQLKQSQTKRLRSAMAYLNQKQLKQRLEQERQANKQKGLPKEYFRELNAINKQKHTLESLNTALLELNERYKIDQELQEMIQAPYKALEQENKTLKIQLDETEKARLRSQQAKELAEQAIKLVEEIKYKQAIELQNKAIELKNAQEHIKLLLDTQKSLENDLNTQKRLYSNKDKELQEKNNEISALKAKNETLINQNQALEQEKQETTQQDIEELKRTQPWLFYDPSKHEGLKFHKKQEESPNKEKNANEPWLNYDPTKHEGLKLHKPIQQDFNNQESNDGIDPNKSRKKR
ncbi:hypothetical protein HpCOL17_08510 [Helicobacter pylori]